MKLGILLGIPNDSNKLGAQEGIFVVYGLVRGGNALVGLKFGSNVG